jgi:hypoxanthine phosphoribosyltransferase
VPTVSIPPFITADTLKNRITELAAEIRKDAPAESLHLICVLKGGVMFLADLIRAMKGDVSIDFMALSSYGSGTTSSGEVRVIKDLDYGLEGRHVIIVEDIVDTGLLSKPSRRKIDVTVDYIGFTIEDRFVVGYGLDYSEQYRNLPYIGVLQ